LEAQIQEKSQIFLRNLQRVLKKSCDLNNSGENSEKTKSLVNKLFIHAYSLHIENLDKVQNHKTPSKTIGYDNRSRQNDVM